MSPLLLVPGALFRARTIGALQPDVIDPATAVPSHLAGRVVEPRFGVEPTGSGERGAPPTNMGL